LPPSVTCAAQLSNVASDSIPMSGALGTQGGS
jgi:hypothetical protein